MTREEKILGFMNEDSYIPLMLNELMCVLCVSKDDEGTFCDIIQKLLDEGKIVKTHKKRYMTAKRAGFFTGEFKESSRGYGFVCTDDGDDDIFVAPNNTLGAMNKDIVQVQVTISKKGEKKREGEIKKIIKRANETIIGTFESSRNFGFVICDDKKISRDIFIPKKCTLGAKDGDKVVVKITKWAKGDKNCEGEICEILGKSGVGETDILSILKQLDIEQKFGHKVVDYIKNTKFEVTQKDIDGRVNLRDKIIFTIDGEDAKDLDDAVSLEQNGDIFTLGVHIADVSHYVSEGSLIDKEAFERATSVYLADRVIPMLPKELSNGICSLNPRTDRLTLSVFMDINKNGSVINHSICESVINSVERMTYTDVKKIVIDKDKFLREKYSHITPTLDLMLTLSQILKAKRSSKGSIDFNFPETKIVVDENGDPTDIYKYTNSEANQIIEEFMLICNQTVAEYMYWTQVPFVYRIHEKPSIDKITKFNEFIRMMGYSIRNKSEPSPREFSSLLEKIKGTNKERIISTVMLRSLMKARYCEENEGHFGLAFEYYCHFTSPIRRYPDLLIHRIIKEFLKGPIERKRLDYLSSFTAKAAVKSSDREVCAIEAERAVEDLKKAQYMRDKIGETFDGVISSVTSFGFFAELENTVEGLVRVSDLDDDYYIYDEKNMRLVGEKTGRTYTIGDAVRVVVSRVSVPLREIDFILE